MSNGVSAGAASVDITPPVGMAMTGYAARTRGATGTHDPLSARAVVVDDTAIVCVDVLGLHHTTIDAIRQRCDLDADKIVVAGLHTHGGPETMPERADPTYLKQIEDACVAAVAEAQRNRRPANIFSGHGDDPGIAKNRRHTGGRVDATLPVLQIRDLGDAPLAVVVSYACHPVVLGADNRLWTADYPGVVRRHLEKTLPGATALFLTGCIGDANIGHSAEASITTRAQSTRTYENAQRIGEIVARCAGRAKLTPAGPRAGGASADVTLAFERREKSSLQDLAAKWREESSRADPTRAALLRRWIEWAQANQSVDLAATTLTRRMSALRWGKVDIVALPGEIFAETALDIRARIDNPNAFVIGFANDNPGYIPPRSEYRFGGYEVEEAHRYYGQPATFKPGSAEALADMAVALVARLRQ